MADNPSLIQQLYHRKMFRITAGWKLLLLYGLPIPAIMSVAWLGSAVSKTVVFALAFSIMGAACVMNTRECGRVHCAFTGPWFLLAALVSVVHGLDMIDLGRYGWAIIGNAGIWGAVVIWIATESMWGQYFRGL